MFTDRASPPTTLCQDLSQACFVCKPVYSHKDLMKQVVYYVYLLFQVGKPRHSNGGGSHSE